MMRGHEERRVLEMLGLDDQLVGAVAALAQVSPDHMEVSERAEYRKQFRRILELLAQLPRAREHGLDLGPRPPGEGPQRAPPHHLQAQLQLLPSRTVAQRAQHVQAAL